MRSPFLVLGFALGASLLPACSAADGGSDLGTTSAAASAGTSATQALNDMLDTFWDEPAGELRSSATSYWINAQAMDAVLDGVERSHGTEFSKWVPKIIDGNEKEFGGWFTASYGETFFDDITWMTLALIRASDLSTGWDRAKYLGTARTVFQRVMDEAPSHDGGAFAGLWWSSKHDHDEKATASNFGPVIAAARLYERTNDATYKTFAATVYDYWHAHMIDTMPDGSDFVIDSTQNGEKELPRYTYNQGLGIQAALCMHDIATEASHKATHYAEAVAMADYLTLHETRNGVLLDYDSDDKTPSACTGDCAAFKGIAYRYLAKLYERDTTRTDYYEVLEASRNAIVAHDFSAKSGTFGTRWDEGGLLAENRLAANASAVMALQIYAELPPPSPAP